MEGMLGVIFSCDFTGDDLLGSSGDNLPKSTGDDSPHSTGDTFWIVLGKWLHWDVWCSVGEQSYIKTAGMLVGEYLYAPLGNVEIFWGYPTSLRLTVD